MVIIITVAQKYDYLVDPSGFSNVLVKILGRGISISSLFPCLSLGWYSKFRQEIFLKFLEAGKASIREPANLILV